MKAKSNLSLDHLGLQHIVSRQPQIRCMNTEAGESDDRLGAGVTPLVNEQTETEGCHVTLDLFCSPLGVNGLKAPLSPGLAVRQRFRAH